MKTLGNHFTCKQLAPYETNNEMFVYKVLNFTTASHFLTSTNDIGM